MAFSPKESIQADLLCSHLASAIKSFADLSVMLTGEGVSKRIALLASVRLAAITLQTAETSNILSDGARLLSRLAAQQAEIYLELEHEHEEDSALLLDDCGFTSEVLGESATMCEECGEYHPTDLNNHSGHEQPS